MIDNSYLEKKGEKKKSKQRKKRKKENGFQPAGVEEGEKRSGLPENGEDCWETKWVTGNRGYITRTGD